MKTPSEKPFETIAKLKTPEECELLERNAIREVRPDVAVAARKRALELRALAHGARSEAERECLEAIYAYERVLTAKYKKTTRASRTWQMVKRHGILGAVERAVNRKEETVGYTALLEMGLEDYAFEAVIIRYPGLFSAEAVKRSSDRLQSHLS
jgi:hypothetical protein